MKCSFIFVATFIVSKMGWGLCILQDANGFIQVPDADFFTDVEDYEGIPPHAYDLIYNNMLESRSEIDMARDEGTLDFARETASEAFDVARHFDYDSEGHKWQLHRAKIKDLKDELKKESEIIANNKPVVNKIKADLAEFYSNNYDTVKSIESEIESLKAALEEKVSVREALMEPAVLMEDKLKSYKKYSKNKYNLQKILKAEEEWATME